MDRVAIVGAEARNLDPSRAGAKAVPEVLGGPKAEWKYAAITETKHNIHVGQPQHSLTTTETQQTVPQSFNPSKPILKNKFAVYPGNHHEVVIEALKRRGNLDLIIQTKDEGLQELSVLWSPVLCDSEMLGQVRQMNNQRHYVQPLVRTLYPARRS